ncbi:MAG: NADH-quinone oxidoreductase subunit C [Bacteroidota bacterium]
MRPISLSTVVNCLEEALGPAVIVGQDVQASPPAIQVLAERIAEVCQVLHAHETTYLDYLACITAIDNGPAAATMEVIYNLYSIPYDASLMIKVMIPRTEEPLPTVPTVSTIWQAARWHEREAYDLVGIQFAGHPDLRRILLPADWQGHPLRQDYQPPAQYHGIDTN